MPQATKKKNFVKSLNTVYYNDLLELSCLISRINNNIIDFSHVSDYLPESFFNKLKEVSNAIDNEIDKRQENF